VTVALLVIGCAVVLMALVAMLLAAAAISDAADVRTDLARLAEHVNRQAGQASPARTAELERATGVDLVGLPPHVQTIIRLMREMRRG
jgi:hypothetical protein